jgi:hypothetical protein
MHACVHVRTRGVTNGSKTTAMDVIDFLCVSLGSSTVQLYDSLGSRRACACSEAGFNSLNGDHARGMNYWIAAFYSVLFCGKKNSIQRIFLITSHGNIVPSLNSYVQRENWLHVSMWQINILRLPHPEALMGTYFVTRPTLMGTKPYDTTANSQIC